MALLTYLTCQNFNFPNYLIRHMICIQAHISVLINGISCFTIARNLEYRYFLKNSSACESFKKKKKHERERERESEREWEEDTSSGKTLK